MEKGDLSYHRVTEQKHSPYVMGLLSTTQDLEPLGTSLCEISLGLLVLEDLTCGLASGITPWASPLVSMKKGTWAATLMFPDCGSHVTIRFTRLLTSPLKHQVLGCELKRTPFRLLLSDSNRKRNWGTPGVAHHSKNNLTRHNYWNSNFINLLCLFCLSERSQRSQWSLTPKSPASTSQGLGLQESSIVLVSSLLLNISNTPGNKNLTHSGLAPILLYF